MSDALADLLKELRQRHELKSPFVFLGRNGKPIHEMKRSFVTACRGAGVENSLFHDLRHTFASWLAMKRVDLKTVQEFPGHKTLTMIMRYAHLNHSLPRTGHKVRKWTHPGPCPKCGKLMTRAAEAEILWD